MKLAITGKGGVGKTTIAALLAKAFKAAGQQVLAVDADPNATLAASLGFPSPDAIPPVSEMADLIQERTGVKPGTPGAIFKLNPRVEDIPDRFAVEHDGIKLLRMGAVKSGGAGCYCPENAFLRSLVAELLLGDHGTLIMDMEAGIEHLGRGTAQGVERLLIVVEPSQQSFETAKRIRRLAGDIGLNRLAVVGNKSRSSRETEVIRASVGALPVWSVLPYDEGLRLAEQEGREVAPRLPDVKARIAELAQRILRNEDNAPL